MEGCPFVTKDFEKLVNHEYTAHSDSEDEEEVWEELGAEGAAGEGGEGDGEGDDGGDEEVEVEGEGQAEVQASPAKPSAPNAPKQPVASPARSSAARAPAAPPAPDYGKGAAGRAPCRGLIASSSVYMWGRQYLLCPVCLGCALFAWSWLAVPTFGRAVFVY